MAATCTSSSSWRSTGTQNLRKGLRRAGGGAETPVRWKPPLSYTRDLTRLSRLLARSLARSRSLALLPPMSAGGVAAASAEVQKHAGRLAATQVEVAAGAANAANADAAAAARAAAGQTAARRGG